MTDEILKGAAGQFDQLCVLIHSFIKKDVEELVENLEKKYTVEKVKEDGKDLVMYIYVSDNVKVMFESITDDEDNSTVNISTVCLFKEGDEWVKGDVEPFVNCISREPVVAEEETVVEETPAVEAVEVISETLADVFSDDEEEDSETVEEDKE